MKQDTTKCSARERVIYILLIILLVLYGLRDSEYAQHAVKLIHAVYEAFTLLFTTANGLN